jgi:hypothetical protein
LVSQPKTVSRLPDSAEKDLPLSVAWRDRHLWGHAAPTDDIPDAKTRRLMTAKTESIALQGFS